MVERKAYISTDHSRVQGKQIIRWQEARDLLTRMNRRQRRWSCAEIMAEFAELLTFSPLSAVKAGSTFFQVQN